MLVRPSRKRAARVPMSRFDGLVSSSVGGVLRRSGLPSSQSALHRALLRPSTQTMLLGGRGNAAVTFLGDQRETAPQCATDSPFGMRSGTC